MSILIEKFSLILLSYFTLCIGERDLERLDHRPCAFEHPQLSIIYTIKYKYGHINMLIFSR